MRSSRSCPLYRSELPESSCHSRKPFVTGQSTGDILAGKARNPAFRVGEQANASELRLWPHIKPVACAIRYTDQIVLLAQQGIHLVAKVQIEQALAPHEEPHFILAVGMLVQKLLAEGFLLRVVRVQADHIGRLETAFLLQARNLFTVGFQNLLLAGIRRQITGWPLFETHSVAGERITDSPRVGHHDVGLVRLALVKYAQGSHGRTLMISSSHSKRNSKASTWRRQSAMVLPQVYRPWPRIR